MNVRWRGSECVLGLGRKEIIQAIDMQQRNIEIDRGFAVWRIKRAVLGGMPIYVESHVESFLDICRRGFDIQNHAIGWGVDYVQALRLGVLKSCRVVSFRGTKSFAELLHAQIFVVAGTLRIVELLQQLIEFGLIA